MDDSVVYAYKPEQGRLSGGSFEKQTEYFLNHLRGSVVEEIETLTTSINSLLDKYNTLADRVTALADTVNTFENRISLLETDNTQNRTNIRELQESVNTLNDTVATIQETVTDNTTDIGSLVNSISTINTTVSTHETQIETLETSMTTVTESVETMETTVEEARSMVESGRHASVYVYGSGTEDEEEAANTATWYKVAETEGVGTSDTLQLNILAQPVGEQEGPAFTWVVEADENGVKSTGHTEETIPEGMADNFVVTSWDVEDEDADEIESYTFQIQFQTAGSEGTNGWTDWVDVELDADGDLTWSLDVTVGSEVTGLVADEVNVRVRYSEEETDEVEGTLSDTLELTLEDGDVVTITTCTADTEGTGLTVSGTFTPAEVETSYTRYYALWCHMPEGSEECGWKFTIDAEASANRLDSTAWTLYQLTDESDEAGADAIPETETVHATTFKNTVPNGLIALVNTDTAPDGFALCDGTDDTPDLSAYVTDTLHYVQKA